MNKDLYAAASRVKKTRRNRKLRFSDRHCEIPAEIQRTAANVWQGDQNFKSAPKFPPNRNFSVPAFALMDKNFPTIRRFSNDFSTTQN